MNKMKSHSTFWLGERNFARLANKDNMDPMELVKYQRSIGKFVRILTKENIPVTFRLNGDSYTDGEKVVISSNINQSNFDSVVGLALHEGSHIVLSDFDVLHNFESSIRKIITKSDTINSVDEADEWEERVKQDRQYFQNIWNVVEDRRCDYYVYTNSPGYKPYYEEMYDRFFNDRVITKALQTDKFTDVTKASYRFRIINFTNPKTRLDVLPDLDKMYNLIFDDLASIDSSEKSWIVAFEIYKLIIENVEEAEKQKEQEEQESDSDETQSSDESSDSSNSSTEQSTDEDGMETSIDGAGDAMEEPGGSNNDSDESSNDDEKSDEADETSSGGSGSETDETDSDEDEETDEGSGAGDEDEDDEEEEDSDEDSDSSDGEETDEEDEDSENESEGSGSDCDEDSDEESDSENESDENEEDKVELTDRQERMMDRLIQKQEDFLNGENTQKATVNKSTKDLVDSLVDIDAESEDVEVNDEWANKVSWNVVTIRGFSDKVFEVLDWKWRKSSVDRNPDYGMQSIVDEGILLGKRLGKKLQIRNRERTTTYNRKRKGKLDKRRIHALGHGSTNVFNQFVTEVHKDAFIHLSIDGSGSMNGSAFDNSIKSAVAMAQMADMTNIDIQISLRITHDFVDGKAKPVMWVVYDSREDSINSVKKNFKYLSTKGITPEGLCFETILDSLPAGSNALKTYFINYSDGLPNFYEDWGYDTPSYSGTTARKHTREQVKNMEKLGYKVLSFYLGSASESGRSKFQEMYGRTASFIDPTELGQLVKTLQEMFTKK